MITVGGEQAEGSSSRNRARVHDFFNSSALGPTVSAEVAHDSVRAVKVRDLRNDRERVLTAKYFIDATEMGDLLPLTKT